MLCFVEISWVQAPALSAEFSANESRMYSKLGVFKRTTCSCPDGRCVLKRDACALPRHSWAIETMTAAEWTFLLQESHDGVRVKSRWNWRRNLPPRKRFPQLWQQPDLNRDSHGSLINRTAYPHFKPKPQYEYSNNRLGGRGQWASLFLFPI